MTRLYARARRGVRISEATPQSHWRFSPHRRHEHARHGRHHDHPESTDREIFSPTSIRSLPEAVCGRRGGDGQPQLHKVDGVRQRIEATHATLL